MRAIRSEQVGGAAIATVMVAAILWLLILGLGVSGMRRAAEQVALFVTAPAAAPTPPPAIPPKKRTKGKEGAAAPANIRSTATEVTAPPLTIPPPKPTIAAAPVANTGVQSTQGAAPVPGPGTGAGGVGNGTGSGGYGDGDGGGDETPPRWIKGRIKKSDYPRALGEQTEARAVSVRFAVEADGTVDECRITRSSGAPLLDATVCRLIVERYRYRPSLDEDGRPVKSYIVETHSWDVEDLPDDR